jgi:hypothetical protein
VQRQVGNNGQVVVADGQQLTGCPEIFSRVLRSLSRLAIQVSSSKAWLFLLIDRLIDTRSVLSFLLPCSLHSPFLWSPRYFAVAGLG